MIHLAIGFVICLLGSWMTYTSGIRQSAFFPLYFAILGICGSINWSIATRGMQTQGDIYLFSVCFDVLMLVSYYFIPTLFAGVHLGLWQWIGIVLILLGMIAIKTSHMATVGDGVAG